MLPIELGDVTLVASHTSQVLGLPCQYDGSKGLWQEEKCEQESGA